MTLWRRAPRSVYQVYDEESYLSGDGAAASVGEPTGASGLDGVSGPAGAGRSAGEEREQMETLSHGPRAVRLLALGLLGVVSVIAATIIAAQTLHHSQAPPAPIAGRRDRVRSAWTATPHSPTPASRVRQSLTTRTGTVASVAPVPAIPLPPAHGSAAASSRGYGRSGVSAVSPSASPTWPSVGVADAVSLPASELSSPGRLRSTEGLSSTNELSLTNAPLSASESQVDDEFGFER